MKIEGFDWDFGNLKKIKKHGLEIDQIEDFLNSDPFVWMDEGHSQFETRFIAFGGYEDKYLFVAFTLRAMGRVLKLRVISARYARKREMEKFYEKKRS